MVRIGGSVVIFNVAVGAIRRQSGKLSVSMTVTTTSGSMLSTKNERGVLEDNRASPVNGARMTVLTLGREAGGHMVGLTGPLIVREMTGTALGRCAGETPITMALSAFGDPVSTLETKARHQLVVPRPAHDLLPALRGVTFFATATKL